ncbi:hypothetical protein HQ560_11940, partial [bacterium]|nr:hypothetical protein [bacterium]
MLATARRTVMCLTLGMAALAGAAEPVLRLANIFNDHMVLQRGKRVRVWGWAAPGAKVAVALTEKQAEAAALAGAKALEREPKPADEEKAYRASIAYTETNAPAFATAKAEAVADKAGLWQATFGPLAASFKPKCLVAVSGKESVAVQDVLVGEVWVCAGQSNMASSANRTGWLDSNGMLPTGVRYAHTGKYAHYRPQADLVERSVWKPCTQENVRGVSTIGYLFGTYLHRALGVPVGIINAASGGAQGNYWCSLEELHAIDFWAVKEIMAEHDAAVAAWEAEAARKKLLDDYEKDFAAKLAQWEKDAAKAKAEKKRAPKKPDPRPPGRPQSRFL